ncbi:MAG: hypothetical protein O7G87_01760, partial [bacterium]|nr:hypothetical protein [bacterium]
MTDFKGSRNFIIFALALVIAYLVGTSVSPTWTVEKISLDARQDTEGRLYYIYRGNPQYLDQPVPFQDAHLHPDRIKALNASRQAP